MINFTDEVLASAPKYTITHSDNTTEQVSIYLATTVTTQGTPLNKVLFDAIDSYLCPPRYYYNVERSSQRNTNWLGFV